MEGSGEGRRTPSFRRVVPSLSTARRSAGGREGSDIEDLRHTRDVAHPGRCHPPTTSVLSRALAVEFSTSWK
eukprot:9475160-Pyramimonas_sp.AAC.1